MITTKPTEKLQKTYIIKYLTCLSFNKKGTPNVANCSYNKSLICLSYESDKSARIAEV